MAKKILSRGEAKNQKRAIVLITLFCLPIVALYFTFFHLAFIDPETGAIIVYPLDAVYYKGIYYSMKEGDSVFFGNYVAYVREYMKEKPLQVPGSGVIVYRTNEDGEVEVLLQLRGDFNQYGLPGGGIEIGETYEECAVNELLQETAYIARKDDLELANVYAGPKHVTRYPNGDIVFDPVVV